MSRPLRVLMVSSSLAAGGAERFTATLLRHLDRKKFSPQLCLLRGDQQYEVPPDVPIYIFTPGSPNGKPKPLMTTVLRRPWVLWQFIRRLQRLVKQLQPDVILSNLDEVSCVTGTALRLSRNRTPWIARLGTPLRLRSVMRRLRQWSYANVSAVAANSVVVENELKEQHRSLADRAYMLANPTDFAEIDRLAQQTPASTPTTDKPTLICITRLVWQKQLHILLRAVEKLQRHSDLQVWICGEGPLRQELETLCRELSISQSVNFLGYQKNPYALLTAADIFVLTSSFEGQPNALIEAQGLGLPAVVTRYTGGAEAVVENEVTGLLVEQGDIDGVAGAIGRLIDSPELRRLMGAAARKHARRLFDCRKLVSEWEQLMQSVVTQRS